jgi:hypothetical protein
LKSRKIKTSKKDEFETTEQFQERIKKEFAQPIVASMNIDSLWAFVDSKPKTSYDADSGTMTVSKDFESVMSVRNEKVEIAYVYSILLRLTEEMSKAELKMRKDAFEAEKRKAKKSKKYGWEDQALWESGLAGALFMAPGVKMFGISFPPGNSKTTAVKLTADITPGLAKSIKDSLNVLYIGKLRRPYIHEARHRFDTGWKEIPLVHLSLYEAWLFDKQSGKILSKVKGPQADESEKLDALK